MNFDTPSGNAMLTYRLGGSLVHVRPAGTYDEAIALAKAEFPAELAHVAHDLIKFTIKASINGAQGHAVRLSPSAWAPVVSRMQRGELIDIVVLSSPAPDAEPRIHSRFELEMMREAAFAELIPPPPPYYRNDQRSDDWTARAGLGRRLGGTRTQKESQRLWNGMF